MGAHGERVFERYKRRALPGVLAAGLGLAAGAAVVAAVLSQVLGPVAPFLSGIAALVVTLEWLILYGNGRLRREVEAKLRGLGYQVPQRTDRFVGLAYPCHLGSLHRRMIETDDDVGFLRVTPEGIDYRGDAVDIAIPAANIASVACVRSVIAPWGRVEVKTIDGEPYDSVIFDSRHRGRHSQCRQDNRALLAELQEMMRGVEPAQRLVHEAAAEALLADESIDAD